MGPPAGPPTRPRRLVVVTGTGTEVGKTWVACGLLRELRAQGQAVAARKPAQSFEHDDDPARLDAALLAAAAGSSATEVCPPLRSYPLAMAPPMAAEALGLPPFTVADLTAELAGSWPAVAADVGLVEGAGGVAAPQAGDGDTASLVAALAPELAVLVAPPGLGTINLVRLSVAALRPWPVVVHLNPWVGGDPLAEANRRWLAERDALTVTTTVAELAAIVGGLGPISRPGPDDGTGNVARMPAASSSSPSGSRSPTCSHPAPPAPPPPRRPGADAGVAGADPALSPRPGAPEGPAGPGPWRPGTVGPWS